MIYDVTRLVSSSISVWPGDTRYQTKHLLKLEEGASVNLTTLTLSAHTGTHADAYYHFEANGAYIGMMPLAPYIGPAVVVTVAQRSGALTPSEFAHLGLSNGERLLIHSHRSDLSDDEWTEEYPYLSPELIAWLAERGCPLIGLDSPSVDAFDSKDLPAHHALYRYGIANLENLYLRDVPDGRYELIALPLKLDAACGCPVRAILRTL